MVALTLGDDISWSSYNQQEVTIDDPSTSQINIHFNLDP
jgi:hypothetical protein